MTLLPQLNQPLLCSLLFFECANHENYIFLAIVREGTDKATVSIAINCPCLKYIDY
jgi:hypothetical protein